MKLYRVFWIRTRVKLLAVVLRPREVGVVHHRINHGKHREESIDTNVASGSKMVEFDYVTGVVPNWAVTFLADDFGDDHARLLSNTFLQV
jgi:hypothetical protein